MYTDKYGNNEYDYTSLIYIDNSLSRPGSGEKLTGKRLADLNKKKRYLERFEQDFDKPNFFDNRLYIYINEDIPSNYEIGFWDWSAEINHYDSDRDFVHSKKNIFSSNFYLVKTLKEGETDIADYIRDKFETNLHANYLIGFPTKEKLKCALIRTCDLNGTATYKLDKKILSLPLYSISIEDILQFKINNDNLNVYACIDLDKPNGVLPLLPINKIISQLISKRLTRSFFRESHFEGKKEFEILKNVMDKLPEESVIDELEQVLGCTHDKAKDFWNLFWNNGSDVFEELFNYENHIEDYFKNSQDAQDKLLALAKDEWHRNHADLIEKANKELLRIKKDQDDSTAKLEKLKKEIVEKRQVLANLNTDIYALKDENKGLIAQFDKRINDFKKDFIPHLVELGLDKIFVQPIKYPSFDHLDDQNIISSNFEKSLNDSFVDELDKLTDNFCLKGIYGNQFVEARLICALRSTMYSCLVNKTPLLLVGSESYLLARAFSYAIFGQEPILISSDDNFSELSYSKLLNSNSLILIRDCLYQSNLSIFVSLLLASGKTVFLQHTNGRDLTLLSSDIVNSYVICFTDLFVSDYPSSGFNSGHRDTDFSAFNSDIVGNFVIREIRDLKLSKFTCNMLKKILSDARSIADEYMDNDDKDKFLIDFLFGYYPYAQIENIDNIEDIKQQYGISNI